ncbi:methylated-DNA--[protein]-cysteine S-methyltransferase [Epidermidibacterium keratini]|uniref:Methylated-DNA--protein-cysteine methyltransferase n=1 Tax=Epidermidibacterium keratini TaxID=1891644 RepID=A0A7L4YQ37_9ACTN|nr:methylated-DNA--[protein]-cysteine S-methyltransferase [Epidermidibacterium keratini]QHC01240.1 methylated-DNA--[protein]-cysteine S-methyltransferase [Epidermidibacterium keratini]
MSTTIARSHEVIDSPIGPLTVVASDAGVCGLYMQEHRWPVSEQQAGRRVAGAAGVAADQLAAYFAGELTDFDVPLDLHGTDFQLRVWNALRQIPYGHTRSYLQQSQVIGDVRAIRAVGTANGRNPVSIIVPCHRVVGSDGSLTGYGGGVERKRFLLDLESRVAGETLF